ncbi:hypothetical protein H6F67_12535 [Microcoleus sp. FACHB-1515]|uniref:hypothetical protein n=1 Tax=Cyanophyceae TaxID=3028117 RepID=UPI0016881A93|nr:hypothetical protein [Microcoleus sp. FACHB-1515]MBD2090681.1 hypothetical protein [Microcoleus sp. FACHB-1515]
MSIFDLVLSNSSSVERVDRLQQLAQTAQQLSITAQGTQEAVIANAIAATLQRSVALRHCWPWCNPRWDEGNLSSLVRSISVEPERSPFVSAFCRFTFVLLFEQTHDVF